MWLKILFLPTLGILATGTGYTMKNIAETVAEDEIIKANKPVMESLQRIEKRQIDHLTGHG